MQLPAILGQSEVFISLKQQLPYIPKQRLYTLTASAMSTVSASIIGAYFTLIEPKYVVTAVVLNLFVVSLLLQSLTLIKLMKKTINY